MIVVADASAIVEYLLGAALGDAVGATIEDPAADLHVPALCDVEVASALRGLTLAGQLEPARALEAVTDYADLPITRHGHVELLDLISDLRHNFSAYDATYLALASSLAASLLTCDEPFARAVRVNAPSTPLIAVTA